MTPAAAELGDGSPGQRRKKADSFFWPSVATVLTVYLGSLLATGSMGFYILLLWVPLGVYAFFRAPPHVSARVLLLLALVLEPPDEKAGNGYWVSPLKPASALFYDALHKIGVPGMSLPLVFFLALAVLYRARKVAHRHVAVPKQAVTVVLAFLAALVALALFGLASGGAVKPMFWQSVQMLNLGVVTLTFLYALRGPRDFHALATITVVAAVTKALFVVWVYEVVCRPLNIRPFYATTHSDTITFSAAILLLIGDLFERPDRKRALRLAGLGLFLIVAIVMNNRRLAFVCVFAGAAVMFALLRASPAKRKVIKLALFATPPLILYVLIGGRSSATLFAPAKLVLSVIEQKDSSSGTRDVENYNLIATLKQHAVLGHGFGHEYVEFVRGEDISQSFSMYRYIAHNSVLWIWSWGGLLGFTSLWLIYAASVFLSARGYRLAESSAERAAGLTAIAVTCACLLQAWGDMGICSYTPMFALATCYAMGAKLCGVAAERARESRGSTNRPRPGVAQTTGDPSQGDHVSSNP